MKHLQYEYAQEALEAKREQLADLEKVETQATRVASALERGGRGALAAEINNSSSTPSAPTAGARDSVNAGTWGRSSLYGAAAEEPDAWVGGSRSSASASAPASSAASPRSSASMDQPRTSTSSTPPSTGTARSSSASRSGKRFSSNYGLLGALSHTFQSVMDVDPEATRRNNIAKLRDSIAQLEEALALTEKDLQYATNTIQSDLDRFQRQKVTDFKGMMIAFAKIHREFARVVSSICLWCCYKSTEFAHSPPATLESRAMERGEGSSRQSGASARDARIEPGETSADRRQCTQERRLWREWWHDDVAVDRTIKEHLQVKIRVCKHTSTAYSTGGLVSLFAEA
jgi:sorting nexin-41/42